jgi:putative chitinase
MIVWPSRFKSLSEADKYAHNPSKLAGFVYGKRKGLGNITEADGWIFRGSGFIQMTGRSNFVAFGSYTRQRFNIVKPLETWADLIRNSDEWAIHSACYIYAVSMDLIPASLADNMKYIVKRINGGYIGIDSRMKYYERCKKYVV